jgi:hypothetical protein
MKRTANIRRQAGSSMLAIMMVIATLSACIVAAASFTSQTNRNVERSNTLRRGLEVGDGALDFAFAYWRETCRAQTNVQLPSSSFTNIPVPPTPPPVAGAAPITYTLSNYKVVAADQRWKPMASTSATPVPSHGMTITTVNYHYLASADLTLPALGVAPITVKMRRTLTKSQMSPWNYAIFFVDDLEHHPGPASTVTGWVHTNAKLYTAHNSLTYQSKVSYGDDWEKNYKPGDSRRTSTSQPGPNWQQTLPPFRDQGQQPFGLDSSKIIAGGTSQNDDSYRELIELPASGADPIADARYYNQADVKVLVNSSNVLTIKRKDGTTVTASSTGNDLLIYKAVVASVTSGTTITDKREAASVRLVDVDVGKLVNGTTGTGAVTGLKDIGDFKGVVYISDQSATATAKRGVRLKNGAIINRSAGITFATDNGLYIQGDYNTGRVAGVSEPPSNTGTPTSPTVSGYTRKPAAVAADAVMILSNNWNDTNSSASLSSRVATPTTVNAAIVSGIVPTAAGNYSGGAENFPRFLETWTGKNFTYYGSMVELYASQQFASPWKDTGSGNNVYDAPNRRWYFDTNFYTTPPPGTLTIVSYNKGRWFLE